MIDKIKLSAAVLMVGAGVAAFYYFGDLSVLARTGIVVASVITGLSVALTSAPGQSAWEFAKDARTEVRKVVWPTRRETVQATLVVLLMVVLVGLYLWLLDTTLFWVVYDLILGAGRA